jgi:hypothetical protein
MLHQSGATTDMAQGVKVSNSPPPPSRKPLAADPSVRAHTVEPTGPSVLSDLPPPPPRVFTKPKVILIHEVPPGLPPPVDSLKSGSNGSLNSTSNVSSQAPPLPGPKPSTGIPLLPRRQFVISIQEFRAEQAGDLGFGVGERIAIVSTVDENWYEGELHGQRGIFPKSFVKPE